MEFRFLQWALLVSLSTIILAHGTYIASTPNDFKMISAMKNVNNTQQKKSFFNKFSSQQETPEAPLGFHYLKEPDGKQDEKSWIKTPHYTFLIHYLEEPESPMAGNSQKERVDASLRFHHVEEPEGEDAYNSSIREPNDSFPMHYVQEEPVEEGAVKLGIQFPDTFLRFYYSKEPEGEDVEKSGNQKANDSLQIYNLEEPKVKEVKESLIQKDAGFNEKENLKVHGVPKSRKRREAQRRLSKDQKETKRIMKELAIKLSHLLPNRKIKMVLIEPQNKQQMKEVNKALQRIQSMKFRMT